MSHNRHLSRQAEIKEGSHYATANDSILYSFNFKRRFENQQLCNGNANFMHAHALPSTFLHHS